jgi:glycyl-tRNA synthetase alpha chain
MDNYTFRWVQTRLEQFWDKKNVSIILPYDLEMGAATYSPFSTIKMLEPNELSVGFIQKCRRPYDSMAGNNGNRLYSFHQFQVMLKGDWPQVVEDFLESLEYIGLDLSQEDVKFIESDWNSPSIGAYGIGWEVQINGMEVAQFTHFKKIALMDCPFKVTELTYGIERLLLKLNKKNNIYECMWDSHRTYESMIQFNEKDFGKMALVSNEIIHLHQLEEALHQSQVLMDNGSYFHGYEYILKACHIYNLLDMGNQIGSFQRGQLIKKLQSKFQNCITKVLGHE